MIDDDPSGDFHGHKKLFLALRVTVNGAGAILWQCQEDGVCEDSIEKGVGERICRHVLITTFSYNIKTQDPVESNFLNQISQNLISTDSGKNSI